MASLNRGPAKIYAFPARGRFASDGQQSDAAGANLANPRVTWASSGSGWYHEEAIREAEQQRKN
ncbi:DUF2735 domain-containing protein [Pseudorhodoplanes sinuspersici]|uniref:Uncharacterized protein n=1 Tax=Pseudorhodoplanes sinuspersici TaxID=1235591 RepID=A0A1W6ZXV9_9HYPH|nr:DUF2735 domain-containing protein [Pseudorhodoplanes sinuspersici]ARQ02227.1 hypothetical protein CAK95_26360 [Pseudorhodoplanes sinuspersici]RKE74048.1 uncharacterized protein DUF2735 [Pseudorhodoplanes sinuspersici]